MHFKKLANVDWKDMEDKVEKKTACWKGGLNSIGRRLILIETALSNVPTYMLSMFRIPKGVLKRCDFYRSRMLWQEKQGVKKYHLVRWPDVCQPKDQGGLGISNLEYRNTSLLCKWLWRLENDDGLWQQLLRAKYLKKVTLTQCKHKPTDSHFWSGLMSVKDLC
jgi:hypothetical protein